MQDIAEQSLTKNLNKHQATSPCYCSMRGGRMTKWKGEVASYAPSMSSIATRLIGGVVTLTLTSTLMTTAASAAIDRHWDANQTNTEIGGSGTWNLSNAFWSPNDHGVSGPFTVWNNSALDNAIFGGTAGTVNLGSPITAGGLIFNTNN